MADLNPHKFVEKIQKSLAFPSHGWGGDTNRSVYLIFPILRATAIWEKPNRSLSAEHLDRLSYFHVSLRRILYILAQIAHAEKLIKSGCDKEGSSPEEYMPVETAKVLLPVWVEYFYIYFKILADRLVTSIGPIVSNKPGVFPQRYRALLGAARNEEVPNNWNLKVKAESLLTAVKNNSQWYELIADNINGREGIRESLVHRPTESIPVYELDTAKKVQTIRLFLRAPRNASSISRADILGTIPKILESFCKFLSSLPKELWVEPKFAIGDIIYRTIGGDWPAITHFFPKIS